MAKRLHEGEDGEHGDDPGTETRPQDGPEGSKRAAVEGEPWPEAGTAPLLHCTLPPRCDVRPRAFYSLTAFEAHYARYHADVCHACRARLPSPHLLDLHVEERHDALFRARAAREDAAVPAYRCLVETCAERSPSVTARRRHLIRAHHYPPEYRFNVVQRGLPKDAQSLLFPPRRQQQQQQVSSAAPATVSTDGAGDLQKTAGATEMGIQRPNRRERRAQAREEQQQQQQQGKDGQDMLGLDAGSADQSTAAVTTDPRDGRHRQARRGDEGEGEESEEDPRRLHARAVEALFRTLDDPDDLEPAKSTASHEDDVVMDDLALTLDKKARLVPSQIRFGRGR